MAKVNLTAIKSWYKTGLKPNQTQFEDTWDSFVHKDDMIPIAQIEGVQSVYDTLNNHINSPTAHAFVLQKSRFIPFGTFQIFKAQGNINQEVLEVRDIGTGFIDAVTFIPLGIYLGGNPQEITSWDASVITYEAEE